MNDDKQLYNIGFAAAAAKIGGALQFALTVFLIYFGIMAVSPWETTMMLFAAVGSAITYRVYMGFGDVAAVVLHALQEERK